MGSVSLKADTGSFSNSEIESSPAAPTGDPGAPIDDYLLPMLGIGIFIGGYVSFKKSNRSNAKG